MRTTENTTVCTRCFVQFKPKGSGLLPDLARFNIIQVCLGTRAAICTGKTKHERNNSKIKLQKISSDIRNRDVAKW